MRQRVMTSIGLVLAFVNAIGEFGDSFFRAVVPISAGLLLIGILMTLLPA